MDSINRWADKWLLKINIKKCMKASYGRKPINDYEYYICNSQLDKTSNFSDLGVTFDTRLNFKSHIDTKISKAQQMLGILKRHFKYATRETFLLLYKAMVRSHLEYANSVWNPNSMQYVEKLEKVQMRATKLISSVSKLSYSERLKKLNLPTLKYRRLRGDAIEAFKIIRGFYDHEINFNFKYCNAPVLCTRGNSYRLFKQHVHYDLRRHFFTHRIIEVWNSLPDDVICADSVNAFKNRIDKFWKNQDIIYDYKATLAGTGNRTWREVEKQ